MRSRRGFIGTVAAALAAVGFAPARAFGTDTLSLEDFAGMVKTRFYLANADGTAGSRVKLLSVEDMSIESGVSQFNLQFRGNKAVVLPEGMYYATNWSGYPNFYVHIQMIGTDRRGRALYRAGFALLQ